MSSWGEKVSRLLGGIASQLGTSMERPPASGAEPAYLPPDGQTVELGF